MRIATTGEAKERSGHTDRLTHSYYPRSNPLPCSVTTCVPGEFLKPRDLDEPLDWSAKRTPNGFLALTDRTYTLNTLYISLQ